MTPLPQRKVRALRKFVKHAFPDLIPEAGDYQSFADVAESYLLTCLTFVELQGAAIAWDSDGSHANGIVVQLPDGTSSPLADPFDTEDDDTWLLTKDSVDNFIDELLALREKYAEPLKAARKAFERTSCPT